MPSSNCFAAYRTTETSEGCEDVSKKFTRTRCESGSCGVGNNKRDHFKKTDIEENEGDVKTESLSSIPFLLVGDDNNETISSDTELTKRVFEWPRGPDLDEYIIGVTDGEGPNALTPLIPDPSTSTSVFEQFCDEPLHIGTGGLCSCTSLFIVSDKAVYAAHYYESLAFEKDEGFQKQVINFLLRKRPWRTGNYGGSYPGLAQKTKAYIMTPALQVSERVISRGRGRRPARIPIYDVSRGGQFEYLHPQQDQRDDPWIYQLQDTVKHIIGVRPSIRVYETVQHCQWACTL